MKTGRIWRRLTVAALQTAFAFSTFATGQQWSVPGSGLPRDKPEDIIARKSALVTVDQLEQAVAAAHGKPDKKVEEKLGNLELTERLSTARLKHLLADLPGEKSRLALVALADASAFLDLPAKEILSNAAPDAATQGQIMSRAVDFVLATVSKMPNFFAIETTTRFQDMKVPSVGSQTIFFPIQGFLVMDKHSTTVTYRNGQEVMEAPVDKKHKSNKSSTAGLTTQGVFGQLLDTAMGNIRHGKVTWDHWEQGPTGPLAVFHYAVPQDKSSYLVQYCCFQSEWGDMRAFRAIPGYHGEIAIDPASGAVLRLLLKTDLRPELPMKRSDQLVEYGPVEIGGKTYICPLKSISITKAKALASHGSTFDASRKNNSGSPAGNESKPAETVRDLAVTAINDVVFENYHLFRAEVRILSEDSPETEGKAPASVPAAAPETAPKR